MFDVTKLTVAPKDVLIFAVDTDTYNMEECRSIYDAIAILEETPDVKIIFVPSDLIKEIVQINTPIPLYYNNNDLTTTTAHTYSNPTTGHIHFNPTTKTINGVSIEDTQW